MSKQSREARETRLRNLHLIDKLRSVQADMRYLAKLLEQRGDSDYCSAFEGDADAIQTIFDDVSKESAGVVDGCNITDNGDGTISISSGTALLRAAKEV